ncbi:4'-phosphopantetheinyl transferase family protein [Bacillus pseudomycoides]|uniref:4'-phosphopantetheinyl transferase family protein n=1 Tax=Bacillus pseudomycoides TaxID=64104 RepID=UPI0001A162DD|nr:4'-phosphopantetheinyl transferase superfamily protein [Bacillus pseudomycoides]EEM05993.1 Phosphopantethiene-protein transferase [Bacillus pseudomycoides]PEJ27569.1 phosphopantetheine-protein transferase [Bacillus pseudomycoides]PFW89624.1 phosphopantetheine-protein transferase [Bacillus pseudomycoides]PFX44998.1 phosphopantetheine-protein transferase [Bacillus pseudomycoides]PFY87565.1 phosphopantetheine-protein transferase [Bacillus pseudomycoides]
MIIYCVRYKDLTPLEYQRCLSFVSKERQEQVKRFRFREDALRSLLGELLTRYILTREYSIPNCLINFERNTFGKPFLKEYKNIYFNVSHSGQWIVCAVDSNEVGIDVEKVDQFDIDIAKRFFLEEEYLSLKNIFNENDKKSYFYKLWTLKESYVKAKGKGLQIPLNSFKIEKVNNDLKNYDFQVGNQMFLRLYSLENYFLSICSTHTSLPKQLFFLDIMNLINMSE